MTGPDGVVRCTHTIKRGSGVRRTEIEVEIPEADFERHWPLTAGRRIAKTRHRVPEPGTSPPLTWEIDDFDGFALVVAEMELPSAGFPVMFPSWLTPHVVREVTDEPSYRNFALATDGPPVTHGKGNREDA